MILIQILIGIIVPVAMIICGRKIKKSEPEYMGKGLAYKSKFAQKSEETWHFANLVYGQMLFAIGINVTIIAALFLVAAVYFADASGWILAAVFVVLELICLLIPRQMTEILMQKTFDENGELINKE